MIHKDQVKLKKIFAILSDQSKVIQAWIVQNQKGINLLSKVYKVKIFNNWNQENYPQANLLRIFKKQIVFLFRAYPHKIVILIKKLF